MRCVEFKKEHLGPLVARMRLRERETVEKSGGVMAFSERILSLSALPNCNVATVLNEAGQVCCVGGINHKWKGVAEFWLYTTDIVEIEPISFLREMRVFLDRILYCGDIVRAEATVDASFDESVDWLEWMGFEKEGRLRRYGLFEEDHYMMARIR